MQNKKKLVIIFCLLISHFSYGQNNSKEYNELIEKANLFVRTEDYKSAALTYATAFRLPSSIPTFEDHYNAACSWSLAHYPDSAIAQLYIITGLSTFTFSDIHELLTDSDLTPIMKDIRMANIKTKMFLKAYETFLSAQKKAGVTASFFKQDNIPFAVALGNRTDSAILKLNEPAYTLLRKKNYKQAFQLFKLNIKEFGLHYILYRNLVDYYLTVGDTANAFSDFARSEAMKYEDPDITADSSFNIDSAIKTDYYIFSKNIGYKVVAPGFLMSNFSTSKFRKDVSKQIIDTSINTSIINPAYPVKHPVVGYDEGHRNALGVTGRMKKFGELLQNDGYKIIVDTGKFTLIQLRKYDILITGGAIANIGIDSFPQAYTGVEIQAVRNWVVQGGSLLLMTDHPPFDISVSAMVSGLDSKSGIGIVLDSINTFIAKDKQEIRPGWIVFSKENKGLGMHPILMGRDKTETINSVMTQGGSSVTGPMGSTKILSFAKSAENQMHRTFIGPTPIGTAQMIAYNLGKGRVVITADGTMFSAQTVTLQDGGTFALGISRTDFDNKQLALNVMHWLSGAIK